MQKQSPQLGEYFVGNLACPGLPDLLYCVLRQPSVLMHKSAQTGRVVSFVSGFVIFAFRLELQVCAARLLHAR